MRRRGAALPRDAWLENRLKAVVREPRAPRGFTDKVMNAVYRQALASPASLTTAGVPEQPTVLRWYRKIGFSFMVAAAVLAASLLLPPTAYPALIGAAAPGAALGPGPSAAVKNVLDGAGATVQAALGERLIGGGEQ